MCQFFILKDMDFFASRINAQVALYVSWKSDPSATYINAFTVNWENISLYAFFTFQYNRQSVAQVSGRQDYTLGNSTTLTYPYVVSQGPSVTGGSSSASSSQSFDSATVSRSSPSTGTQLGDDSDAVTR